MLTLQDQLGGLLGNIKWVGGNEGGRIRHNGSQVDKENLFRLLANLLDKIPNNQGNGILRISIPSGTGGTTNIIYRPFSSTAEETLEFQFINPPNHPKYIKFRFRPSSQY